MTEPELESRRALHELIALLQEIDERYLGDEWGSAGFGDTVDGFRSVANMIEGGFFLAFDSDPERPFFRPIVSRSRKMLGDNPDALYYTAPVRSDRSYRVTGNLAGSVYLSFTVERGSADGGYSTETAGVLARPRLRRRGRRELRGVLRWRASRAQLAGAGRPGVGADRPLLLRRGRAGRGRREPHRAARDRGARAGRSAAAVGRRRRGGRVPTGRQLHPLPHPRAGQAGGAGAAHVGVRDPERVPAARAPR